MKKHLILIGATLLSLSASASPKENFLSRLFKNASNSSKQTTQIDTKQTEGALKQVLRDAVAGDNPAPKKAPIPTEAQIAAIVNPIAREYSTGKISADSLITLALYHKVWSPEAAARLLRPVAEKGNAKAKMELGAIYAFSPQYSKERNAGLRLLEEAAKGGYADANAYLGLYYYNRNDYKKAKRYLDACNPMKFGFGDAAYGGMCMTGKGLQKSVPHAREFYKLSSYKGYPRGMSLYGHNLRVSSGGPVDYPAAFFWLYLAADTGDDTARSTLYLPLRNDNFDDTEQGQDATLALQLIGLVHKNQKGTVKDEPIYKEGFLPSLNQWERKAEQGDDWARYYLGSMNYNGDFLNQNYKQALRYYEPIAKNGRLPKTLLANVNERLAEMYAEGKGTAVNPTKALSYRKAAARCGSLRAYLQVEGIK